MGHKHTLPPEDLDLKNAIHEERHLLQKVEVPIVTVSATFRKELADKYKSIVHTASDVVYSRGHYSMAEAVRKQAIAMGKSTHLSDPTNFASKKNWKKIEFTESVGLLVARYKLLKWLRNKADVVMRGKLPIKEAITEPLLYLTGDAPNPIISMHYETGTILSKSGKTVLQAVTDPHVHHQYLDALPSSTITYAVFDDETRDSFFALAKKNQKEINEDQVVVTGPFVHPEIVRIGMKEKKIAKGAPINIAITTGGLGTNFEEIKKVLESFAPLLAPPEKIRLFLFASTHSDFRNYFEEYAKRNNVRIGDIDDEEARIRILYDDSIIDANENLIKYMFPWAHGVITKPSGDMAYDAAVAGCFLLFLSPWGEWEKNVSAVFIKRNIGFNLSIDDSYNHFLKLHKEGKLETAMKNAHNLPEIFRDGCKNLINLHSRLKKA